ncbi:hypothetical protein SAMN05878503_105153 [Cereibacter ovatus]|uniref:IraD/Gp25-like domain-containing protein n=1 Tax=Cereibacter ovatus TaxID=439529 RepID=A0A285CRX8_9RHOB|nr:GPW/gp25 family protein [Cereibacter ovatus]SNX70244.1 hypothetical protein SAMN05878503_105153 [Cereibacter ovatus]
MARRFLAQPFALGPPLLRAGTRPRREGLAETDDIETHIRDCILAVLFTRPAERVMRPRFGAGLDAQLFEAISPLALSAVEYRIRESLAAAFGAEVEVQEVTVEEAPEQGAMLIRIDYARRADRLSRRLEVVT